MIFKILLILFLLFCLVTLIRKRLLNIDLSFPWFVSMIALAIASTSDIFIHGTANLLGIVYHPLVVIMISLFILLSLVTVLAIYLTEIRRRQILIIRKLALQDIKNQLNSKTDYRSRT